MIQKMLKYKSVPIELIDLYLYMYILIVFKTIERKKLFLQLVGIIKNHC